MPTSKEYRECISLLTKVIRAYDEHKNAVTAFDISNAVKCADALLSQPEGGPSGEGLIYAPGQFDCPKCGFHLVANNINVRQGTVSATAPADRQKCSNCPDTFMEPTTWKAYAKTLENRFDEAIEIGKRQAREGQRQATMTEVEALAEARKRWGKHAVIEIKMGEGWKLVYEVRAFTHWNVPGEHGDGDSWEAAFKAADKERGAQ